MHNQPGKLGPRRLSHKTPRPTKTMPIEETAVSEDLHLVCTLAPHDNPRGLEQDVDVHPEGVVLDVVDIVFCV